MIKNLVFDMGNVLIKWTPDLIMDYYHISDAQERALLKRIMFATVEWALLDWGKLNEIEAEKIFQSRLPKEYWHDIHNAMYWFDNVHSIDGMVDFIKHKKEQGFGIYLLSNAPGFVETYKNYIPGIEYFDGIVISGNVGLVKPMPEIYQLLLQRFSLKAEECLFVDDLTINCAGALLQGMKSLVFRGDVKEIEDYLYELNA